MFDSATPGVNRSRMDALKGAINFINRCSEDYIVMSDCDVICNIDLKAVVAAHEKVMRQTAEKILVRFLGKGVSEGIFRADIDVDVVAMMFLDMQYRLLDLMTGGQMTKEEVHRIGHQRMDILMRGILSESGLVRLREKVKNNI